MKRLIVCCDGTWQSPDNKYSTNVLRLAQAVKPMGKDEVDQVLYYDEGLGAIPKEEDKPLLQQIGDLFNQLGAGAFGWWIDQKIKEAYIFLCLNYHPGDEIYLFGFSRGAYTVRSLAGLINCSGLLKRPDIDKTSKAYSIYRIQDEKTRNQQADIFRQQNADQPVTIKFLGCWDTVGALGMVNLVDFEIGNLDISDIINRKYKFHNHKLSSIINHARHAVAIDESRKAFKVTPMETEENSKVNLKQVWFPGDHGCVGGGEAKSLALSLTAFKWMADEAINLGLDLNLDQAEADLKQAKKEYQDKSKSAQIAFATSFLGSIGEEDRSIAELNPASKEWSQNKLDQIFHRSVRDLWLENEKYRPRNLEKFEKYINDYWHKRAETVSSLP